VDYDDLPAALAANLDAAFERLVLAYQRPLYSFALRLIGRREDAEEVAQDAFIRAYRALSGYPPERVRALALRPWIFRIALNVARNRVRGHGVQVVPLGEPDGAVCETLEADRREQPEAVVERAEQGRQLAALVTTLPERYRAAVILRHVEGLSYGELALALDQPIGTVKANVHRGIHLLRTALVQQMSEVN
jgi:RNA polymerase sigma-70 factor (ECF subfamily)